MGLFSDAAARTPSQVLTLPPGATFQPDQGWYWFRGSNNPTVQRYDPITQTWRSTGHDTYAERLLYFDGTAERIANTTGCAVGAVITNAGTGYTSAPAVTAGAGGSVWTAVLGGALSTAAVIAVAGSGYTYPPLLWIEAPPQPGAQATGYTTISNGTIASVTINGQGAGYLYPPNVVVVNDWRDQTGSGGQVSLSITGAGTITHLFCTNHGNAITSGTVPALTFTGGGGSALAATTIMDWVVQAVSITTPGAGYTSAAGALTASGAGGYVTATPAYLGGSSSVGDMRYQPATIDMITNASGGIASVGNIIDAGRYQGIPTPVITAAQTPTTGGVLAFTMGGANATIYLVPAQQ